MGEVEEMKMGLMEGELGKRWSEMGCGAVRGEYGLVLQRW